MEFKSKHVDTFLAEGNKVKVTIRFRGRELAHTELGKVVLDRVLGTPNHRVRAGKPTSNGRKVHVYDTQPQGQKISRGRSLCLK
jgi:translation initiation factor IF-3